MGWIITLLIGGFIGWLASRMMDASSGLLANILIGIFGSALGRWVFGDLLGIGAAWSAGHFSFAGIVFGVLGAALLIWLLKAMRVLR